MRLFTHKDVEQHGAIRGAGSIALKNWPGDLIACPLWHHQHGLSDASGYGARLVSRYKLSLNGRLYRIYHTCYGNASSAWIKVRGRQIYIY